MAWSIVGRQINFEVRPPSVLQEPIFNYLYPDPTMYARDLLPAYLGFFHFFKFLFSQTIYMTFPQRSVNFSILHVKKLAGSESQNSWSQFWKRKFRGDCLKLIEIVDNRMMRESVNTPEIPNQGHHGWNRANDLHPICRSVAVWQFFWVKVSLLKILKPCSSCAFAAPLD